MQRYDGEMDARGAMFSFPACTRDATQASRQADARTFHFPLVREMQHEPDDGLCLFHVFISRLYARCNIQYLAVSLVMLFISRLYARCNLEGIKDDTVYLFSFPACTRDATSLAGWRSKGTVVFISRLYARCNRERRADAPPPSCFHFPLVREMQPASYKAKRRNMIFISRLYARCNQTFLAVS